MSALTIFKDSNTKSASFHSNDTYEIQSKLQEVGVRFERWHATIEITPDMTQDEIMTAYQTDIDRLKLEDGYQTVDVVSMHPDHPQRDEFRQKFLFEHRHTEDEVRFFVAGEGLFCLHLDGQIFQVLCTQDDLISVPAHTPHWFDMGSTPSFTAIRLFNNTEGWIAHATGSEIATQFPLLD